MALRGPRVGLNCKFYYNTASHGSPTWVEATCVKDVNLALDITEVEAAARLSVFKQFLPGLCAGPIEFNLLAITLLPEYDIFKTALLAHTVMDFAMADDAIASTGTEYWRADYYLFGWKRGEPLEECATVDVKANLAYSANVPAWVTV